MSLICTIDRGATSFTATILGAPRTKKTHNAIVRAGGKLRVLPSPQFRKWAAMAVPQLRVARRGAAPIAEPVNVAAVFFRDARTGDAVGYYQALADALEDAGVVADDKWIVAWDGSRLDADPKRPRIELTISTGEAI